MKNTIMQSAEKLQSHASFGSLAYVIVEGLRETKKAATRRALASAVVNLAVRDGLERVTAEAIAAEANVSVRTYHNYFASKDDALQFYVAELMEDLLGHLRAAGPEKPFNTAMWDALIELCCDSAGEPTTGTLLLRLVDTEPRVKSASSSARLDECKVEFERYFADRMPGADPLYCWLVLSSGVSAVRMAVELWAEAGTGSRTLRQTIEFCLAQLDAGLGTPLRGAD